MTSLFFRVVPELHESLTGYLMRSAERNRCGGPDTILRTLYGNRGSPILRSAELLADHCRCTVDEITRTLGFCRRSGSEGLHWYVSGQWITKEYFVSPRSAKVCARCLQDASFIRGLWDLTFYLACPAHGVLLSEVCVSCGKHIAWNRHQVLHCRCGFDLRRLPTEDAHPSLLLLSSLIESHLDPTARICSIPPSHLITMRRLAELSLDGLLKTIWLLGHILPTIRAGRAIRGRNRPARDAALVIVANAFQCLASWPAAFMDALDEIAARPVSPSSAAHIDRLFTSVHRYLDEELSHPETAFLKAAYEHQVRQIWRRAAPRRPLRNFERQMELDLG